MTINFTSTERTELRKTFLEKRKLYSESASRLNGDRILAQVLARYRGATFLSYHPLPGEVDLRGLWSFVKEAYFPKIEGEEMVFLRATAQTKFLKARFGFEPESRDLWQPGPGVILVPGVVFHRLGYRLGFGKGFYDRFLSQHAQLLRLGIAHDFQISNQSWPQEPHDQVLDSIYCPGGVWGSSRKVLEP